MSGVDTLKMPQWHTAREHSYRVPTMLPARRVALAEAIGETLAEDVVALCDVPHYASSAMDGWAVAGSPPWLLVGGARLQAHEATPIVTGGLVPDGTDAVLQSEYGIEQDAANGRTVTPAAEVGAGGLPAGRHVRPAGEEVRISDTVVKAHTLLNPAHISVCAVCGHDDLPVLARPRVRLVLTGNEVVEAGIPEPGHVRDTFGPQLPALIRMLGGIVTSSSRLGDDRDLLVAALERDQEASEVIITTGGTGSSSADHLHPALEQLGATLLIDEIAMRPGGPNLLARLADGRFLVGLPGNPLAAMMGILTIAQPLLAGLRGAAEPRIGTVTVAHDLDGRPGRSRLAPYRIVDGVAEPSRWFGSGMLRGLAEADGVLVCPPEGVRAGESVDSIPLPWHAVLPA